MAFKNRKRDLYNNSPEKIRYIIPKNRGNISNSITQNWTDQALMCYLSNQYCETCAIKKNDYSFVCQMPKVIKILIKQLGVPDTERIEKITV
ncbi:MAG: hypothetical protein WCK67_01875 [bacterium]